MSDATLTHWVCLDPTCDAHGTYVERATSTDTSPARKHPHGTLTTTSAAFAERLVGAK